MCTGTTGCRKIYSVTYSDMHCLRLELPSPIRDGCAELSSLYDDGKQSQVSRFYVFRTSIVIFGWIIYQLLYVVIDFKCFMQICSV